MKLLAETKKAEKCDFPNFLSTCFLRFIDVNQQLAC